MKLKIISIISVLIFFFLSCETTQETSTVSSADIKFKEEYNRQTNSVSITSPDFVSGLGSNLNGNIFSDEKENIEFLIIDNYLGFRANYSNTKWLFGESVTFYDEKNVNRVTLKAAQSKRDVVTNLVFESFYGVVTTSEALKLAEIFNSDVAYCYFHGQKSITREFKMNPKIKAASKAMVDKWFEVAAAAADKKVSESETAN